MPDRCLVISATNVLARGFFLVPTDRRGKDGEPVNGLFALARATTRALAFKAPARAVAVLEASAPAEWPPLLQAQVPKLGALFEALGIERVRAPGELDLVAAYARAALDAGDDVVVVGTDKRFAQLVGERAWWYDANKDARYTTEMVVKRFGVPPAQVAEWLALVGNEDDGLPGIAGIGAKGAAGLLTTHGSVARALEAMDSLPGRVAKALAATPAALAAELSRARLKREGDLPLPWERLAYRPPEPTALNALYRSWGMVELLAPDVAAEAAPLVCRSAQDWEQGLRALQPGPVSVELVAAEPPAPLVGLALATEGRPALYVPSPHELAPLRAWLEDPAAPKIGHDLRAAEVALRRRGLDLKGVVGDSACASHLSQPSNWAPHDLALVAKHVLGRALETEDEVRGVGRQQQTWSALAVEKVAAFASRRATAAAEVWSRLAPSIDGSLLAEYLALSQTLVRMELRGIGVDAAELTRADEALGPLQDALEKEITALAGRAFNLNSSKQLGEVLFSELKLPIVSHTKTGWSTATEALERIDNAHPVVPLVIRWRLLRRMRDSWITALRGHLDPDGRVRSSFHPARSFSGHIVSSNPDLSRVPGRTAEMERIRRAFVAKPGHVLMSVDYNQLGLHVLAHLTGDPALIEPLRSRLDVHAQTASAVLERPLEDIGPTERQLGKVVNFATFAGQGASALALQLGVPAGEAKQLIARFDRRYSRVRAFQAEQLRRVQEQGHIVTLAGRRWPISGLGSLDPHDRSYAERLARRATHEGSVADVARRGLLRADRALREAGLSAAPLVQVIDEVLFEVPEGELEPASRVAAEAMRGAFELAAPLRVGVWAGPNWADLQALS